MTWSNGSGLVGGFHGEVDVRQSLHLPPTRPLLRRERLFGFASDSDEDKFVRVLPWLDAHIAFLRKNHLAQFGGSIVVAPSW